MSYARGSHSKIIVLTQLSKDAVKQFDLTLEDETKVPSTSDTQVVPVKLPLKVCFDNLFNLEGDVTWIPCIPNYYGGVLRGMWEQQNPETGPIHGTDEQAAFKYVKKFSSQTPNVPFALFFTYPSNVVLWSEVFLEIGKLLPAESSKPVILVIPTFGTNNGITYHDSALGIFTGLRCVAETADTNYKFLREIRIITPYSEFQETSSCRTIAHLHNMIDIFNNTDIESGKGVQCALCMSTACNIVLPCGHMLTCEVCDRKLMQGLAAACMLCKAPYSETYKSLPVHKVPATHKCCDSESCASRKTKLTYIPCGHTAVRCEGDEGCEGDSVTVCQICNTEISRKMRVYT